MTNKDLKEFEIKLGKEELGTKKLRSTGVEDAYSRWHCAKQLMAKCIDVDDNDENDDDLFGKQIYQNG